MGAKAGAGPRIAESSRAPPNSPEALSQARSRTTEAEAGRVVGAEQSGRPGGGSGGGRGSGSEKRKRRRRRRGGRVAGVPGPAAAAAAAAAAG